MAEFFNMGGHAAFVWPAYGASAIGVIGLALYIRRREKAAREKLAASQSPDDATPPADAPQDEA